MPDGTSAQSAGESLPEPAPPVPPPPAAAPVEEAPPAPQPQKRPWWVWAAGAVAIVLALIEGIPWVITAFKTVSTDDAYVNGHVTFVAPRVPGQVVRVLVDDNNRVRIGSLLVQLDKEPYQVKVDVAKAALAVAQANLVTAQSQVRGLEAQARSQRFDLQNAIDNINNQVADLHAKVAALQAADATLTKTHADYDREVKLLKHQVVSQEQFDTYQEAFSVANAQSQNAREGVFRVRAELGLPPPAPNGDINEVPADLDETAPAVKVAQTRLMQTAAQLGYYHSFTQTPTAMLASFYDLDPSHNIDIIFAKLLKNAPAVKQAEAKVSEAKANLDQAELNLRYCDVVAEIDGVITQRSINPGDHVIAGQQMMALRSLTDIWVDANFKETQLRELRIGQPADLDVDMYGSRRRFRGRISGFTMGTGSTLALLPAENATGNFVKVVQRLPVRIDLIDYNPKIAPLFIGLSVTPYVYVYEKPTGPDAGKMLQSAMPTTVPVAVPTAVPVPAPGSQ
jgi:membrane fusion protein, multidrug efflux system